MSNGEQCPKCGSIIGYEDNHCPKCGWFKYEGLFETGKEER